MSHPSDYSEANNVARLLSGSATQIDDVIRYLYLDEQLRDKIRQDCIKPLKNQVHAALERLEQQSVRKDAATHTYTQYRADDENLTVFLLRKALKRLSELAKAGDWPPGGMNIHRHCVCACIGYFAEPVLAERERLRAHLRSALRSARLDDHQLDETLQVALHQFAERVYQGRYDPNRSSVSTFVVNLGRSRHGSKVRGRDRGLNTVIRYLEEKLRWQGNHFGEYVQPEPPRRPDELALEAERRELLERLYGQMDEMCRVLLRLFALSYSYAEILENTPFAFANEAAARQATHRCKNHLSDYLEQHPNDRKLLLER